MTILHCIPKKDWDSMKELKQFGQPMLDASGFIHCSSVEYFWRVAPNFAHDSEERLLLCIDTDRLDAPAGRTWKAAGENIPTSMALSTAKR